MLRRTDALNICISPIAASLPTLKRLALVGMPTIATLRSKSRSNLYAWGTVAWSLGLAWLVSFAFYQGARALAY